MAKAIEKGVYNDNYIDNIIEQEDEKSRAKKDYALPQRANKRDGVADFSRLR